MSEEKLGPNEELRSSSPSSAVSSNYMDDLKKENGLTMPKEEGREQERLRDNKQS